MSMNNILFQRQKFSESFFTEQRSLFFTHENLSGVETFKTPEKKSQGDETREMHERAEKSKIRLDKSPLKKYVAYSPDTKISEVDNKRVAAISQQLKTEPHEKVSALLMGNIPANLATSVAGSLMNDYS